MTVELLLFLGVGGLAVLAAIGMLLSENAVHSALFLILNFGCVAFLFLMLDAPFISMVQIAVYAGAIMVLFLFVIMLLGAEKTSDTTRSFRRLTAGALILSLIFLGIVGAPLALGQFTLPEGEGSDPMLRVLHASVDVPAVNIEVASGDTNISLANVEFGVSSEFESLPPGDYDLTISLAENDLTVFNQTISLAGDQAITAVAYGSLIEGTFGLNLVDDDITPIVNETSRVTLVNVFSEEPLSLIDAGANDVIDIRTRVILDENGEEVLNLDGEPIEESQIGDVILAEGLGFGESIQLDVEPGVRELDFVTATTTDIGLDVETIRNYELDATEGEAQVIVLAPEPAQFEGDTPRPIPLELETIPVPSFGSPQSIGQVLFTDYLLPVQIVGVLLLVALIGVVALTRPEPVKRAGVVRRRKVSRPLVSVISSQTGSNILEDRPQLDAPSQPEASGD